MENGDYEDIDTQDNPPVYIFPERSKITAFKINGKTNLMKVFNIRANGQMEIVLRQISGPNEEYIDQEEDSQLERIENSHDLVKIEKGICLIDSSQNISEDTIHSQNHIKTIIDS